MRDRLIKLLNTDMSGCDGDYAEELADYLIANGVIVPPCKVDDTVYVIYNGYVTCAYVLSFYIDKDGGMFDTREEAEKARKCNEF